MDDLAVTLQLVALILVGVGGYLLWRALKARAHRRRLETTPNYPLGRLSEIETLPERAEVLAETAAGPEGLLVSPYSQTECVWFRVEVVHHHYADETGDRLELTPVFDLHSHQPFTLKDVTGSALCRPHWIEVEHADLVHDRFDEGAVPPTDALSPPHLGTDERGVCTAGTKVAGPAALTPGCTFHEWVLRPGERVFVRASPHRKEGGVVLVGGEDDPMIVSTHNEQELIREDRSKEVLGYTVLPVALVLLALTLLLG
ncbi:GIDE domain-containing protein [Streptomonospora wellingtoniae]|uniref:RING-type E3 ubiquitin transferase n=1 Tax=Streptomonospora wellingtoniae TaxID=3075544 RepID=A0ABU2KYZ8_9ACTN|nr:GIDE domain-containing protein [Streptomonospora sp. DSM 45055]MDT0304500.1 GIDE domain-containing protein [Streptomonospora sp. DSM 45055]